MFGRMHPNFRQASLFVRLLLGFGIAACTQKRDQHEFGAFVCS